MLEFRPRTESDLLDVVCEGIPIEGAYASRTWHSDRGWITFLNLRTTTEEKLVLKYLQSLSGNIGVVFLGTDVLETGNLEIRCGDFAEKGNFSEGYLTLLWLKNEWDYDFSFEEYFTEFSRLFGTVTFQLAEVETNPEFLAIEIKYRIPSKSNRYFHLEHIDLSATVDEYLKIVKKYHQDSIYRLSNSTTKDAVITFFDFPDEIRTSCKQYLLYFAQFLEDLGIDATSDLRNEAGKVLFSVRPLDGNEALDKIREALATFLSLPNSPIVFDESFAGMRMQQQIANLQHSQTMAARELQLAQRVIESQDKVIGQNYQTIEQQNKIIEIITSKSIMMDSVENKEELEQICEGPAIGKSKFLREQLGIDLNPATFVKTVAKGMLGKPEKTSIIDVEESSDS